MFCSSVKLSKLQEYEMTESCYCLLFPFLLLMLTNLKLDYQQLGNHDADWKMILNIEG